MTPVEDKLHFTVGIANSHASDVELYLHPQAVQDILLSNGDNVAR
jgi:hypothetical protein